MPRTQGEKAVLFRALHEAPGAFVMPNPWDAGSARLLAAAGFSALATSSWASAATLGRRDYGVTREEALTMARLIVEATDLPVSGDMENGFGDSPAAAAEAVRLAANIGLAGCSIEDSAGDRPPYELALAKERVAAAVEAARSLPFPFVLTARTENYLRERPDLDDTIERLQAFGELGADVVFAPGIPELASIRTLCGAVAKPVNAIGYMQNGALSVAQLADAGVKRISLATGLYRAAMTGLGEAAREIQERGTFTFVTRAIAVSDLSRMMR